VMPRCRTPSRFLYLLIHTPSRTDVLVWMVIRNDVAPSFLWNRLLVRTVKTQQRSPKFPTCPRWPPARPDQAPSLMRFGICSLESTPDWGGDDAMSLEVG
jgi:hypothetical protein